MTRSKSLSFNGAEVLPEILRWSKRALPLWQRDALRRLITKGSITEVDISELALLCKAAHGLEQDEAMISVPLDRNHLPVRPPGSASVTISSLTHNRGVNALANGQTLEFGSNLTVVYGPNAAGKSGYTRILKRACRARGAEEVIGNVFSQTGPARPSVAFQYKVGDSPRTFDWLDQESPHEDLSKISVFDTRCATVYLRERTDVAFRPFGLDLFDALSNACEEVKKVLLREQRQLEDQVPALPDVPEDTQVSKALSALTSLSDTKKLIGLATLSEEEEQQLAELQKRIRDLDAKDPKKTSDSLRLRAGRLESLARHLDLTEAILGDAGLRVAFEALKHAKEAREAARDLRTRSFPETLLPSSGGRLWKALWEAARDYSTSEAYPEISFPVTDSGSRCVLCQQPIDSAAADRLRQFETFVKSTAEQEANRLGKELRRQVERLSDHLVTDEAIEGQVSELHLENEALASLVEKSLAAARSRQELALSAVESQLELPEERTRFSNCASRVRSEAASLRERSEQLLAEATSARRATLQREANELSARRILRENIEKVLDEVERKKRVAAYTVCIKETNTRGITTKSTEVTKRAVTSQLAAAFSLELERIGFSQLEVVLEAAGGTRGALYHRLALRRAPGAALAQIASEGESRALAIAAFFGELATASEPSAILFDDPVSSLDHRWREGVARRLAEEARGRQVIVFTHDIVFVLALSGEAERLGVACHHQYVRNEGIGAGVATPDLPWVAMKVSSRIGVLRNRHQAADKTFRTGSREDYEGEAIVIYGLLREAWERALEEVLLGGVVQRYRRDIQTQQVDDLSDITDEDCTELVEGMSKTSRWLPGHDQAGAENVPVPDADELREDIQKLENWVKRIRNRR